MDEASQNDFERAIAAYDEAIRLNPEHLWAHILAANSYRFNGDSAGGLAFAQKAVDLDPGGQQLSERRAARQRDQRIVDPARDDQHHPHASQRRRRELDDLIRSTPADGLIGESASEPAGSTTLTLRHRASYSRPNPAVR